jgi:copper transport protein
MTSAVRRFAVLAALVGAVLAATAAPAFAHATLLTTEPQPGGRFDSAPPEISLRFNEPVEVALGGIRLFDGNGDRVDIGAPEHPDGDGSRVRAALPELDDGTYVVTWRVVSADAHPVQGAFTFQVGDAGSVKDADALARRLLASQGGSTTVGVVYAIDRVAIFATMALLLGGIVFLAVVFPRGRDSRRGRMAVWIGWIGLAFATIAGIALEGVYAAALPLTKVLDPDVFGDVLETRYGRVSLVRLGLLVLLLPLLRVLLPRRDRSAHPLRSWWFALTGLLVVAISFTPGLAGHADTGEYTGFAVPADAIHVLAMACWLGGLVLLLVVVFPRSDPDELREGINRYSELALGAIVALVVTGAFQTWRQVGSFDNLRDTDYGKLLIAKLVAFAALVVAAAFSREIVNRTFREFPDDDEEDADVLVSVGAGTPGNGGPGGAGERTSAIGGSGLAVGEPIEEERRRLRRSVGVEVVLALVILSVTALLVNAAPARTVETEPISMTLKSSQVWVDVVIAPGVAGGNDMHFTSLPVGDTAVDVEDMTVQLTRPGEDIPPFSVPLRKLGPGHYVAPLYDIPYPGEWQLTVRVRLGASDEAVLVGKFSLR